MTLVTLALLFVPVLLMAAVLVAMHAARPDDHVCRDLDAPGWAVCEDCGRTDCTHGPVALREATEGREDA